MPGVGVLTCPRPQGVRSLGHQRGIRVEFNVAITGGDELESPVITMPSGTPRRSEFQRHIDSILNVHWSVRGGDYQRVPDTVGGDGGLEGISSEGDGYQAYADEGSHTSAERAKKQKSKIRADLRKLSKKSTEWEALLKGQKLRSWTLIVPILEDKAVVQYAREQAERLLNEALPFIAPGFRAYIKTPEDFPEALARLYPPGVPSLPLLQVSVPDASVADLEGKQPEFVTNTVRKLAAFQGSTSVDPASSAVRELLRAHLKAETLLAEIEEKVPECWDRVNGFISDRLEGVKLGKSLLDPQTASTVAHLRTDMRDGLARLASLSEEDAGAIATGTIAKWLGLCPLGPPGSGN